MTTIEATLIQRHTVMLLQAYCDLVEAVDEVTTDSCVNCGEPADVWIHGPSTNAPHCCMCASGWCFFYGHEENVQIEVRRLA